MSNIFPSLNRKTSLWKSTSQKQIRSSPWNRLQSRTKSHGRQSRAEFQWAQNWSLTTDFPQCRRRPRQKQQTVYEKKTLTFVCTKKETCAHTCTEWKGHMCRMEAKSWDRSAFHILVCNDIIDLDYKCRGPRGRPTNPCHPSRSWYKSWLREGIGMRRTCSDLCVFFLAVIGVCVF